MIKNYFLLFLLIGSFQILFSQSLKRAVPQKETLSAIPEYCSSDAIIIKIIESPTTNTVDYALENDHDLFRELKNIFGTSFNVKVLIPQSKESLLAYKAKGEERSQTSLGNLSLYYQIDLKGKSIQEKIAIHNRLVRLTKLETVYFPVDYGSETINDYNFQEATIATKATPDLSSSQFYLDPAPDGIDAKYAWTKTGGDGTGINFCDMEKGLHKNHEDLVNAGLIDIYPDNTVEDHHGTAVAGVVYAEHNNFGVDGIAPKAQPYFTNIYDTAGALVVLPEAMSRVIPHLKPGDVFLLEMMHYPNTTSTKYLPVEYPQAAFDVIQNLTANGVIVIEPAGNGNKNLDDAQYNQVFDSTFRYSGAFMVGGGGAGSANGGTNPFHQRLKPSSYGSRVDFFAYSEMVTTTGYGDLYGATNEERYTKKFFGTSSASPIVAGAAVLMESIYKAATGGQTLDHAELKGFLRYGATPSYDPPNDKIGVMPNLKQAVDFMLQTVALKKENKEAITMRAFPQPATDQLSVIINSRSGNGDLKIFDLLGNLVTSKAIELNQMTTVNLNISNYPSGVYFIKVTLEEQELVQKIIKQ